MKYYTLLAPILVQFIYLIYIKFILAEYLWYMLQAWDWNG